MMSKEMKFKKIALVVAVLFPLASVYQYSRPVPAVQPQTNFAQPKTSSAVALPWPTYGQAAIGAVDYGVFATHGEQKPVPIASITKIVTALAVLKQKPLKLDEKGPNITITDEDVAIYDEFYSQGGSVTPITKGSQISEYDGLQSMLIPSSNNMATTVAKWAFGSVDNYVKYANQMLADLGFAQTHVEEASGFSASSASTATELIKLGELALANEVVADIVKKASANLPVAGEVRNINTLVGTEGVIGIKTGNTEAAGGCLLFAAKHDIDGKTITIIGVVLGAPTRATAIADSKTLLQSVDKAFQAVTVVKKGQVVGHYEAPWGAKAEAVAKEDLTLLVWRGTELKTDVKLNQIEASANTNSDIGSVTATAGQKTSNVPVILKDKLSRPSVGWRIFR
ncbi:D-alanyl-D-alanine carboxypeptidase [Candidatus Saccharibacteria bacterium]|nr:D-alanyl-D-alanine carboxypeptidase [Candidatus Saccharibacteria bacterium]